MRAIQRRYLIWYILLIGNLGYFVHVVMANVNREMSVLRVLSRLETWLMLIFTLVISVPPTWLSQSNFRWRHYIGFGAPIVAIGITEFHMNTCIGPADGYGCNFLDSIFVVMELSFLVIYAVSMLMRKWVKMEVES
jgi:hypothetical protein